jgi:2-keto-3-deoxy-L-rhamnonate aldolase RhmA
LRALDLGAAGIFVPHITSAAIALSAVAATRYNPGQRGFSASHRAGGYGSIPIKEYIEASDQSTIIIGQIEDVVAVENIDEIAAVSDLDALFIGPADLSVSYGKEDWNDPVIEEAIDKVCNSARQAGRALGIFQASVENVRQYREKGISFFTISTDQALLTLATKSVCEEFKAACK